MAVTNKQRLDLIEQFIREHKYADLHTLAKQFRISLSTVRRALSDLERRGAVRRHHGGASLAGEEGSPGGYNFITQDDRCAGEKHAIAQHVAHVIEPGMTVLIDGGTTPYAVARQLVHKRVIVVTNSLPVAELFNEVGSSDVIVTGGAVYNRLGVLYGPICEAALGEMHADLAVLGAAGVTHEGIWNSNSMIVSCQKKMMDRADRTLFVFDPGKLERRALALATPFTPRFGVVTTAEPEIRTARAMRAGGTELTVVPAASDSS